MKTYMLNRNAEPKAPLNPPLLRMARSLDSFDVYDRPFSHCKLDRGLLRDALRQTALAGVPFFQGVVEFPRVIGLTDCVRTGPEDKIVFAARPRRAGLTRFVRDRQAVECRLVFLVLKRIPEGYLLVTAFIGARPEPEPWDRHATPGSRAFWSEHALIWGSSEVVPGTETSICPWSQNN